MTASLIARAFQRYTAIHFAVLGAVAAVAAAIFYVAWFVYDAALALLGPFGGVIVSYGLWYTGAILSATILRRPLAAFLGETLGAALEALVPTPGGLYNLVYGALQGMFAEAVYAAFGYKRFDLIVHALAGAASAIGTLIANLVLFRTLVYEATTEEGLIIFTAVAVGYAISGALWGVIAGTIARAVGRLVP